MPTKFRKRPVEVEAVRWTGSNEAELSAFAGSSFRAVDPEDREDDPDMTGSIFDKLHSTWVKVYTGQWVVKGVKGEFYPIDETVLAETYDQADDDTPETITICGDRYEVVEWDSRGDQGHGFHEWVLYATPVEATR